jgi:hypothetical protein
MTAESKEEALEAVDALNFCLEHPELNTPEKINEWFAEQKANNNEEGNAE